VRLRSARSPQSALARGWQKERGWGPGAAEATPVTLSCAGAEFGGGLLTILGPGEGGADADESDAESVEGSDGEFERIEGDVGLGVFTGKICCVVVIAVVVVDDIVVVAVDVVMGVVVAGVVVVGVVLSGVVVVLCAGAGVIVVITMGKRDNLLVVVGDIVVGEIVEAATCGLGPKISFRRSWSNGTVGLDVFNGSMETSLGKSMSSSPSELKPESIPLCLPVLTPVSRARAENWGCPWQSATVSIKLSNFITIVASCFTVLLGLSFGPDCRVCGFDIKKGNN